jgi:hypothetical protein
MQYFLFWSDFKCITLCKVEFKSARPLPYIAMVITANINRQSLLRYEQENANCIRSFCQTTHHIETNSEDRNFIKLALDADQWWNQWRTNTDSSLTE